MSFAKRVLCRLICPGLNPSFIQLSRPETGELLEEKSEARHGTGALVGDVALAGPLERTLASYDVGHNSVLQLEIVVGLV